MAFNKMCILYFIQCKILFINIKYNNYSNNTKPICVSVFLYTTQI